MPHLLHPHEITIVTVAGASDRDFKVVFLVIEIRMFPPHVVVDSAAAEIGAGEAVSDGAISGDDADIPRAIDENAVAGQEFIDLVQLRHETVQELLELPG